MDAKSTDIAANDSDANGPESTLWERLSPGERDRLVAVTLLHETPPDDELPHYTTNLDDAVALVAHLSAEGGVVSLTIEFDADFQVWSVYQRALLCADRSTDLHMMAESLPEALCLSLLGAVIDIDNRYGNTLDATPRERWMVDMLREPVARLLAAAVLEDTSRELLQAYRHVGDVRHVTFGNLTHIMVKELYALAMEDHRSNFER